MAGRSWVSESHLWKEWQPLTELHRREPTPAGFKTELYPHQRTVLAAMIDIEQAAEEGLEFRSSALGTPLRMFTRFATISEKFSSGKTLMSLALIQSGRLPAQRRGPLGTPLTAPALTTNPRDSSLIKVCATAIGTPQMRHPVVDVYYQHILPITLVVANPNVISQWEENVAQFSSLRVFTVENALTLRKFEQLLAEGAFGDAGMMPPAATPAATPGTVAPAAPPDSARVYDAVLLKCGTVTKTVRAPGEAEPKQSTRPIIAAFIALTEHIAMARVIIDDYDTLKLHSFRDVFPPALFTWLISATERAQRAGQTSRPSAAEPGEYWRQCLYPSIAQAGLNPLMGALKVQCSPQYLDSVLNGCRVETRRCVVVGGAVAAMLAGVGLGAALVEMVHANAIGTAAAELGLAATSAADLVRRVIGGKCRRLKGHLASLRAADQIMGAVGAAGATGPATEPATVPAAAPATEPATAAVPATGSATGPADGPLGGAAWEAEKRKWCMQARHLINAGEGVPEAFLGELRQIVQRQGQKLSTTLLHNLEEEVTKLRADHTEKRDEICNQLNRMRDNLREEQCQCCTLPIERLPAGAAADATAGAAYVFSGCCQIVVCEECIVVPGARGQAARGDHLIKKCPNCSRPLDARTLIRIGADIDISQAVEDPTSLLDEPAAPAAVATPAAAPAAAAAPADDFKQRVLLSLLRDEPPPPGTVHSDEPAAFDFADALLAGRRDCRQPEGHPHRTLVFAMYSESLHEIAACLARNGIPHRTMTGTRAQKDESVRLFARGEVPVLVVATAADCAGLHMPYITRCVFYHRVIDRAVAAQVAARGQRLGREYNLEVIELVWQGEVGFQIRRGAPGRNAPGRNAPGRNAPG